MHREDFTLCNHKLSLFQAEKADCPLFYLGLRKEITERRDFIGIAGYSLAGLWGFRLLYHSKCTENFEREMHLVR